MKCTLAYRDNSSIKICLVLLIPLFLLCVFLSSGASWSFNRFAIMVSVTFAVNLVAFLRRITLPNVLIEYDSGGLYINGRFGKNEYIPFSRIQLVGELNEEDMGIYVKPRFSPSYMTRKVGSFNRLGNGGKIRLCLDSEIKEIRFVGNVRDVVHELKKLLDIYRENQMNR